MALPPPMHAYDEDYRRQLELAQRGRGPVTGVPEAFSASRPPMPVPALPQPPPAAAAPVAPRPQAAAPGKLNLPPPLVGGTPTREPGWLETIAGAAARGAGNYERAKEGYRQEALRDPGSAESAAMRKRLGPMLAQLGMRPDELEQLSGEDLQAVAGKGDLISGVLDARTKAGALKAKAAADRAALDEQRGYEEAQKKADREAAATAEAAKNKRELEEEAVRDQRDFGQQKVIAAIGAGAAAGRAADAFANAEAARVAAEERAAARKKADEARKAEADQAKAHRAEEVALDDIEKRLSALAQNEQIPGQEPPIVQKGYEVKKFFTGGTGRDKEASQLQRDLEQLGAATLKAQRGVLSEADKKDAAALYTGDGTVAGSLAAVRARKAKIAAEKAKAQRTPAATISDDPDEADLGTTYE